MSIPRTIATAVDGIARKVIGRDWNLYGALLGHWGEIVGEEYAQVTTPVKISFPHGKPAEEKWAQGQREDGILTIKLPQGLVMEFTYRSDQVRQRIAAFFGYNAIDRIVFQPFYGSGKTTFQEPKNEPAPAQLSELQESLKDLENSDLRNALEGLGQSVLRAPKTP